MDAAAKQIAKAITVLVVSMGLFAVLCTVPYYQAFAASQDAQSTTSMSAQNVSSWSTVKPAESTKYIIQSKSQFRYRVKQTTSSSSTALAGWTRDGSTKTSYGNWSANKSTTSKPATGDTLRITGQSTKYNYYHWHSRYDGIMNHDSKWINNTSEKHTISTTTPIPNGPKYVFPDKGGKANQEYGPYGTCSWKPAKAYWWLESTVTTYTYQTRSKNVTYGYYRWSDWSGWSDNAATSSGTCQVEKRAVYRTVLKSASLSVSQKNLATATVSGLGLKTYTGKTLSIRPVVKINGITLKAGKDYTVTICNSKGKKTKPRKTGTYKVIIRGKGNCSGTITKTFSIKKPRAYKYNAWVNIGKADYYSEKYKTADGRSAYRIVKETGGVVTVLVPEADSSYFLTNGQALYYPKYVGLVAGKHKTALYRKNLSNGSVKKIATGIRLRAWACSGNYLYYGRDYGIQSNGYQRIGVTAFNIKTKHKHFMGSDIRYIQAKNNRVVTLSCKGSGYKPKTAYVYKANGKGKVKISSRAVDVHIQGKSIHYVVMRNSSSDNIYREYRCNLKGKHHKAITKWLPIWGG